MTANDLLAHGYDTGRKLVHMMVDDLTPDEWTRQPVPGANSAVWVVGHLAFVLRNGLRRRRVPGLPDFPAELEDRFASTRQPAGEQIGYGDPKTLLSLFDAYIELLIAWIRRLPAEVLTAPQETPVPFATNAGEAIHFGGLHIVLHAGQLSTIRRSLGKPPLI